MNGVNLDLWRQQDTCGREAARGLLETGVEVERIENSPEKT